MCFRQLGFQEVDNVVVGIFKTVQIEHSRIGTSLLCFLSFQLFFLAILFKLTYYSQNYS